MATEWFYFKGDERCGPVNPQQLKSLVATGIIQPADLIWKEGMPQSLAASKLKGLFEASVPAAQALPVARAIPVAILAPPVSRKDDDRSELKMGDRNRSRNDEADADEEEESAPALPKGMSKKTQNILIAAIGGGLFLATIACCGGAAIIGQRNTQAAKAELAEANRLWDAGQKPQAVEKYKPILMNSSSSLSATEKPKVFQRVIEYEVAQGNTDSAKSLIKKALEDNTLSLKLDDPKANQIMEGMMKDSGRLYEVAVGNAEKDRTKCMAQDGKRLDTFEEIVGEFKKIQKYDSVKTTDERNTRVRKLLETFNSIPFNGSYQAIEAKKIIVLWEEKLENKYSGQLYSEVHDAVAEIVQQYLNRVN